MTPKKSFCSKIVHVARFEFKKSILRFSTKFQQYDCRTPIADRVYIPNFKVMGPSNSSNKPFKDFGAILKFTTDAKIGYFQFAITKARINIFGCV